MKLIILGSGTLSPKKNRHPSAYLIEDDKTRILLDCGHGTTARLVDWGVNLHSINALCVTHFHTDHFGDAVSLVHSRFVDDIQDGKPNKSFDILGPRGLEQNFKNIRKVVWPEPTEHYPINFHESKPETTIGAFKIETFPVVHVPWFESVGFRIKAGNKTIGYPGDVGSNQPFEQLVNNLKGVDLLVIEVGALGRTPNHFSFQQVALLQEKANIKQVVLTHLRDKIVAALPSRLPTGITIARDGMKIKL